MGSRNRFKNRLQKTNDNNLSRKELINLRKRCTTNKFDRKTRQLVENLDEDKLRKFTIDPSL